MLVVGHTFYIEGWRLLGSQLCTWKHVTACLGSYMFSMCHLRTQMHMPVLLVAGHANQLVSTYKTNEALKSKGTS